MSIARLRFMAVTLALAGSGVAITLLNAQQNGPQPWVVGDVFVAVGKGEYQVRAKNNNYQVKQTLQSNVSPKQDVGGCWFDSQLNLYTADVNNTKVVKYNFPTGSQQSVFADTNVQAPDGKSNSIVMAVNGDVFVGQSAGSPVQPELLTYRSDGLFLDSDTPDIENGGIDWMDLATDQQTMFYTSRGRLIKKFNVFTDTQLSDLPALPGTGTAYAIRLLGPSFNGADGLLVADTVNIKRLNAAGTVVKQYDFDPGGTNNDEDDLRTLNLDPDGIHFWAGGFSSGRLYRFSIDSNTFNNAPNLGPIQASGNNKAMGICVLGEPQTQVRPLALTNTTNSTQLVDITAPFGDPTATGNDDDYSFSTWRLRIRVKAKQSVIAAVTFTPQTSDGTCANLTTPDLNDFDCRFATLKMNAQTECVPFFKDPSAATGSPQFPYRCAFYRVKGVPECSAGSPGSCPFDEPFVANSNDITAEIILNLTNPPDPPFSVGDFGPAPKGNPRLARDPDSVAGIQFGIDSTTAVIDWPAFGSGFPNDYSPVQRAPSVVGACAQIISPQGTGQNSGSSVKIVVDVKTGPMVGTECTGNPVTGAATAPNNMTLAIAGQGTNTKLLIYCVHPSSNDCFQESSAGRYQANVQLDPIILPPDTVMPYIFSVTSVQILDANGPQGPGFFPPTSRPYFICKNGSNCGG